MIGFALLAFIAAGAPAERPAWSRDVACPRMVKLDELIRATEGAHDALLDLEELEQSELDRIRASYEALARKARAQLRRGGTDTDIREV